MALRLSIPQPCYPLPPSSNRWSSYLYPPQLQSPAPSSLWPLPSAPGVYLLQYSIFSMSPLRWTHETRLTPVTSDTRISTVTFLSGLVWKPGSEFYFMLGQDSFLGTADFSLLLLRPRPLTPMCICKQSLRVPDSPLLCLSPKSISSQFQYSQSLPE